MRPHLCDSKARKALIGQLVEKIRGNLGSKEVRSFAEICEAMPILVLNLNKADLGELSDMQKFDTIKYKLILQGYHKFCYHHWKPVDQRATGIERYRGNNTGILLWGPRGCGKSQILAYATAWAHENNWINVTITDYEKFTNTKGGHFFRYKNGLYLQKDLAKQLLEDFKHSNE